MKTIADIIASKLILASNSKLVDLQEYKKGKDSLELNNFSPSSLTDLIGQGYDISHAAFVHVLNFTSILSDHICTIDEARDYVDSIEKAADMYIPEGPPISPITNSYFSLWAIFDVLFGKPEETIGTCSIAFAKKAKLPKWIVDALVIMQSSRIGLYIHSGFESNFVKFRELGSQNIFLAHVPVDYKGNKGDVWLARLLPALFSPDNYFIVMTTPYVIRGNTEFDFLSYIERELERMTSSREKISREDSYYKLFKYGPSMYHWNEYIFCSYLRHRRDAIYLTGIPDIKESLPHA